MILHRPGPPLDMVVEYFWWQRRARPTDHREHNLPTGKVQLIIALHDAEFRWSAGRTLEEVRWTRSIVHGPQSAYYLTGPKPQGATVGVCFRTGAGSAALGLPLGQLTDLHVTLEELWGVRGCLLHERLAATTTPESAFAVLEAELAIRLRIPLLIHPAVAHALSRWAPDIPDITSVAAIQRETGYSAKHFIAQFRRAIGLTPKQYLRTRRFGIVARRLAADPARGTLAELAQAAGYADQAHMTRDFRALAGISPTAYRPAATTSAFHHVVDDAALPR